MNKILLITCLLLSVLRVSSQTSEPVIDTSFTVGGLDDDRLYVVRELDNKQVLLGGETNSIISGDLTAFNEGEKDLWVVKHDTASLFGNVWDLTYGGDSVDLFADMELMSDGFVLLGTSRSPISGEKSANSKGGMDYWVIRCDLNGNVLWDRTIGGAGEDTATAVAVVGGNGFLIGGYSTSENTGDKTEVGRGSTDYWVVRLDANGNIMWDKTMGGDDEEYLEDVFYNEGQFLCLGSSTSEDTGEKTLASYGMNDVWLVALDDLGNVVWDESYGGTNNDYGVEVALQITNNLIIGTSSESGANGNKNSASYGNMDVWILQIDSVGGIKWQTAYGGTDRDEFYDMLATPQGGMAIGASTLSSVGGNKTSTNRGGVDYWIFSIDSAGSKGWDFTYGGADNDHFRSIYQGCDRGFLLGGFSESNEGSEKLQDAIGLHDYWFIRTLLPTRPKFAFSDVCYGSTVDFFDISDVWPDSWLWDFGDPLSGNNTSEDQHPQHSFSGPGDFEITLFVQEGCQQDTFFVDTITIIDNKVLGTLDLGPGQSFCEGESVVIDAGEQAAGTTYIWSTGETTRKIVIDTIGVYNCTIQNDICVDTDQIEFDWCPDMVAQSAFSPNGDGVNDFFLPAYMKGVREMDMYIYNRWGEVIFHGTDIQKGWNGRDKNGAGKLVQNDVYVYIIYYKGLGTEEHKLMGHVTIVR